MTEEQFKVYRLIMTGLDVELKYWDDPVDPNEIHLSYNSWESLCAGLVYESGEPEAANITEMNGMRFVVNNELEDGIVKMVNAEVKG